MKAEKIKYNQMTDQEIVMRILADPSDEVAAYFLLHNRYRPLVCKCCIRIFKDLRWLRDCEQELFIYLKGNDKKWNKLRGISDFKALGGWMSQTVYHRIEEIKPKLEGKIANIISIDNEADNGKTKIQLPDLGFEDYERQEKRLQVIEAIMLLKSKDQKLVIIKTLKGYHSKEIAEMLNQKWKAEGIVKIDKGKVIIASPGYVNVLRQRAIKELKVIIKTNNIIHKNTAHEHNK